MELIYYRNFDPNCFINEANFNLSSSYEIKFHPDYIKTTDGSYESATLTLEIIIKNDFSIFDSNNAISDAKVIVGENGSGKSTLLDEIISFGSHKNLAFSWQILIGKQFILIGQKIKLSEEGLNKLKDTFPNLKLFTNFNDIHHAFFENREILTSGNSFFQKINNGNSSLIYYSNSLENHKLPFLSGTLYSRSQIVEEAISLVDISTANLIIQSNKWGLNSQLKEIISEENLLSLDNYQMHNFIQLYFKTDWFKKLLPESIHSKMRIKIYFGSLIYKFSQFAIEILGNEFVRENYPNFLEVANFLEKNYLEGMYKEFLSGLILKILDKRYESIGFINNINDILKDFEDATISVKYSKKEKSVETIRNFTEAYIKNSKLLYKIDVARIYINFKQLISLIEGDVKLGRLLVLDGLDDSTGIILNLVEDYDSLNKLIDSYSNLQSLENFQLPFLKFSPNRLSSGERNYIFLLSRIIRNIDSLSEIGGCPNNFTILLDEPGNDYHLQWQKYFLFNIDNALNEYSKNKRKINVQVIITTHSPFILSDFDKNHIIKLKKENNKTVIEPYGLETFGANIYDLLADSFYMSDGFVGKYAQDKIQDLINFLNYNPKNEESESNIKPKENWTNSHAKKIIEIVGEPFLKEQLLNLYYIKVPEEYNKDKKIRELEEELNRLKNA